jgi:hypothetical protein
VKNITTEKAAVVSKGIFTKINQDLWLEDWALIRLVEGGALTKEYPWPQNPVPLGGNEYDWGILLL